MPKLRGRIAVVTVAERPCALFPPLPNHPGLNLRFNILRKIGRHRICPLLMLMRRPQNNILFKRRNLEGDSVPTLNPNAWRIQARAG
jgi:hypothetical protein